MTTTRVAVSDTAFDMLGPYLTAKAVCPGCGEENVLVHIESFASDVKAVSVCEHIRAMVRDDDGGRHVEFQH